MTREQIETALDSHKMSVRMRNGKLWMVRRNGRTQTWKTRPSEFRIPIKFGFKGYGEITQHSLVEMQGSGANDGFVVGQ